MRIPRWKLIGAFTVLYVGWGAAYLAARFSIETIPPLLSSGTGFTTAGGLLLLWAQRGRAWPRRRDWALASLLGAFMILGGVGGTIWSEQRVASGLAALIVSAEPVWMVLYEWAFERRRPDGWTLVGLAVGLTGLGYLAIPNTGEIDRLGLLVLSIAALLWVVGALLSRRVEIGESEDQGTGLYMFVGGLQLLVASVCFGEWSRFDWHLLTVRSTLGWTYNTFISSLIGFTAYLWLLRVVRVSVVSTYAFINPVIALFLGWALAGEKLSWHTGIASALLVAGVTAITLADARRTEASSL